MSLGWIEVVVAENAVLTFVLICMFIGIVAGILAGLLGIGGGLIIVPVLVYLLPLFLPIPGEQVMIVAVASSLCSIIVTSASSAWAHHKLHHIQWDFTWTLMAGAALGAVLTGYLAHLLNPIILKKLFAIVVLVLALRQLLNIKPVGGKTLPTKAALGVISVVLSTCSSLLGIGGGALYVPMLSHYSVGVRQAIGSASIVGFVIACLATSGYVMAGWSAFANTPGYLGYVYIPAVIGVVSTSSLAAQLGARLTDKLPVSLIKKIFGFFLLLVSARMLFS